MLLWDGLFNEEERNDLIFYICLFGVCLKDFKGCVRVSNDVLQLKLSWTLAKCDFRWQDRT